jgi:hypothetical protein
MWEECIQCSLLDESFDNDNLPSYTIIHLFFHKLSSICTSIVLIAHCHTICHVLIQKFDQVFIFELHPPNFIMCRKRELASWRQRLNVLSRVYLLNCYKSFASIIFIGMKKNIIVCSKHSLATPLSILSQRYRLFHLTKASFLPKIKFIHITIPSISFVAPPFIVTLY